MDRAEAAAGCLLGTALGDALGGHGMCSDDTDHACMVAQALAVSAGNPGRFAANLAWRLRFWLLGLPAGVGWATLRAILKLWLFVPPQVSGVRSAGNGPAMRSALLGVVFADSDPLLVMHTAACTAITHADPRAGCGALAVALAARCSMRGEGREEFLRDLKRFSAPFGKAGDELVVRVQDSAAHAAPGHMYHDVPVALQAWFAHPRDLEAALQAVIRCGGDRGTTAAITGAIVGAGLGRAGLPQRWLGELRDWPRGADWIEAAARNAAEAVRRGRRGSALYLSPAKLFLRNLLR